MNVVKSSENYIYNGLFQKIVWLGVNGFLIINEPDKEILMVDPWPSYSEDVSVDDIRIDELVDWLFRAYEEEYKLIGIIASHEHFDHIADIPTILFRLNERTIPENELPPLYSDKGTFDAIKNNYSGLYFYNPNINIFNHYEIKLGRQSLYYDDKTQSELEDDEVDNYPLRAGTRLDPINIGNYIVTPYIWDHASFGLWSDDFAGVPSGNYQRSTAIFLHHKSDPKRLFIVGSAGEMSDKRTGGFVNEAKIETDMLIQAIPHKIVLNTTYKLKLNELIAYQVKNITVKDIILASHFENFFSLRSIDDNFGDLEKEENQNRIHEYANRLSVLINEANKIYYVNRFLIDYGFELIEEKEDGYFVHMDIILKTSIDQILDNPNFSSFKKLHMDEPTKFLLFKDNYLANPNTMEVHSLENSFYDYRGLKVYRVAFPCNIHRMNFRNMKHFKTIEEAISKGYNGCHHCMDMFDTDQPTPST